MSIRPIVFYDDGTVDVLHDDPGYGCTGRIAVSETTLSADSSVLEIHCPGGCGSVSWHPVNGAADPQPVQQLFVRRLAQRRHVSFHEAREIHRRLLEERGLLDQWALAHLQEAEAAESTKEGL